MNYEFVSRTLLAIALTSAAALAQPSDLCDIQPAARGVGRVEIDARTGRVTGQTRFARTSAAEIVIRNKNPFRYTYKLDVKEEVVPEAGLAAFLPFISPFQLDPPAEEKESGDVAADANDCPDIKPLSDAYDRLGKTRDELEENIKKAGEALKGQATSFKVEKDTLESPGSECGALVAAATKAKADLTAFLPTEDLESIEKAIDALQAEAKLQQIAVKSYRKAHTSCPSTITDPLADRAELLADSAPSKMRENLQKLKQAKQTLADALTQINRVLAAGPMAFTEYIPAGEYDDATTVTVTLERKDMLVTDAKFEPVATRKARFGGPAWFTIAGGAAGSTIDRNSYQRIQGFPVDREGSQIGTELAPIVGEKEASTSRVTPLLMLHGRLLDSRALLPVSLQFSFGVSAKTDNVGTDIEYLIGPSAGFLDNKLFLTVGAYGGRVQTLQGNLYVGAKVPETLTEIPIRKDLKWQLGFGVTYKIK